jgi:hypothetical protein
MARPCHSCPGLSMVVEAGQVSKDPTTEGPVLALSRPKEAGVPPPVTDVGHLCSARVAPTHRIQLRPGGRRAGLEGGRTGRRRATNGTVQCEKPGAGEAGPVTTVKQQVGGLFRGPTTCDPFSFK